LDLELQKNAKIHGWQESYRDQAAVFYKKVWFYLFLGIKKKII
jgi:hypothetical protein